MARRAGVSPMTVSNVVNGHPHVRPATRQRVLEAIAALDYHVNTTARSLRQGRTGVIGLAVPNLDHPYFGLLARLLVERAAAEGYDVVVEQTGARREGELGAITRSRLRSYDGVVLHASELANADAELLRGEYPIVVMGERAYDEPVDHVLMGNEEGARLATRHLIERGCRRIAIIGGRLGSPDDIDVSTLRTRGYLRALDEAGIARDDRLVRVAVLGFEGGRSGVHALLDEVGPVDGIVGATDQVAVGVLRGLRERAVSVPDEVRVVGFDDIPVAAFTVPSLTTIEPDHDGMADAVVRLLLERISGERRADDYREIVSGVWLVERESTAGVVRIALA
ncbi:LacI family DNA-binding transcriptional regulator [Agromyces intestinalis]|uniref:LacI family DNA-binding transcriptional regulator n=1 Tax=Agromyces intestinalis TaxID=2592652 RepID=UPI001AEFB73D|nr:LacI family DNA-binding transcriptional regulator [Agromyces intestinalis]